MPVTNGPGKRETITHTIHLETEYGPVPDRNIRDGDWRNPDLVERFLPSFRMYCLDEGFLAHSGSSQPNWALGGELRDNNTNRVVMRFGGRPPDFFIKCFEEGLEVTGILIGVDPQRHN
jgi:hypothetical protein